MFQIGNVGREIVIAVPEVVEVGDVDSIISYWADLDVGLVVQVVKLEQLGDKATEAAENALFGGFYMKDKPNGYF